MVNPLAKSLDRSSAVVAIGSGTGPNGNDGPVQVAFHSRPAASTGVSIGLCAIAMCFAALSSALIVRKGSGDWKHIALPSLLYLNTFILAGSSLTLEMARRRVGTFMRTAGTSVRHPRLWLEATLALGLAFLGGQLVVWRQ